MAPLPPRRAGANEVEEPGSKWAEEALEELAVLRACLLSEGLLRPQRLLAERHRRRFAAELRRFPCSLDAAFEDLGTGSTAAVCTFLRPEELRRTRAASRTVRRAASLPPSPPFQMYVLGGFASEPRSLKRFDSKAGSWDELTPMTSPRLAAAGVVIAGSLYVVGGSALEDGRRVAHCSAERLELRPGSTWEALPPMASRRGNPTAAAVAGRLYVCGGFDERKQQLGSAECFDPERGEWLPLPPMPEPRLGAAGDALFGRFYVCGGHGNFEHMTSAACFDTGLGSWLALPHMTTARFGAGAAAVLGCLYVCGGSDRNVSLASVERFDPGVGAWELQAPMGVARFSPAVTSLAGCVYVCGGLEVSDAMPMTNENHLDSVECFDVGAGSWRASPPMQATCFGAVAVAVASPSGWDV